MRFTFVIVGLFNVYNSMGIVLLAVIIQENLDKTRRAPKYQIIGEIIEEIAQIVRKV